MILAALILADVALLRAADVKSLLAIPVLPLLLADARSLPVILADATWAATVVVDPRRAVVC